MRAFFPSVLFAGLAALFAPVAVCAQESSSETSNKPYVRLTDEQVLKIWRTGDNLYCLSDGYDINAYSDCVAATMIALRSFADPGIDIRRFGFPADYLEQLKIGTVCPYKNPFERIKCAGVVDLFNLHYAGPSAKPEAVAFANRALGLGLTTPIGAHFDPQEVLQRLVHQDASEAARRHKAAQTSKTGDPK